MLSHLQRQRGIPPWRGVWSPRGRQVLRRAGGSQLGMELSTHQTRETEEGKEEVKEEEEAGIITVI